MSSKINTLLDKMMATDTLLVDHVEELSGSLDELSEVVNAELEKLANMSFSNFSLVDTKSEGISGVGTLTADTYASDASSYQFTSTTSAQTVYSCNFSDVKFGTYALCARIRSSNNTSTSDILTLKVSRGSSDVLSKGVKGTDFTKTDNYCHLCTTFTYDGTSSAKQPLTFKLNTTTVNGVKLYFDYAYITLITPAIYI